MLQGLLALLGIAFIEAFLGALFQIKNYHPITGSVGERSRKNYGNSTSTSYVSGYWRKNGTYVKGHTRRNY